MDDRLVCPPEFFACVEAGLYRSNALQVVNFAFVRSLGVRTFLYLSPDSLPRGVLEFLTSCGIHVVRGGDTECLCAAPTAISPDSPRSARMEVVHGVEARLGRAGQGGPRDHPGSEPPPPRGGLLVRTPQAPCPLGAFAHVASPHHPHIAQLWRAPDRNGAGLPAPAAGLVPVRHHRRVSPSRGTGEDSILERAVH